ncbi:MAG: shikimate kinase AroK [Gammaproteobacteria bacterium]|nr:shikimate kinase AroK [Gammaproteobacteria bacterium]
MIKPYNRLFLIGPMGAGKTTIGRQLARKLNYQFVDSDKELETRAGVDIATIFEFEAEEGFRKREQQLIDELSQRSETVLATGGGAILKPNNRKVLRSRGLVIYLSVSIEQQLERTGRDNKRPLLQTDNPRKTLETLQAIRAPLYEELADLIISTDQGNSRSILNQIIKQL